MMKTHIWKKLTFTCKFQDHVLKKSANADNNSESKLLMLFGEIKVSETLPLLMVAKITDQSGFQGDWRYSENCVHPGLSISTRGKNVPSPLRKECKGPTT